MKPNMVFVLVLLIIVSNYSIGQSLNAGKNYVSTFNSYQQRMNGKTKKRYLRLDVTGIQYNSDIQNWKITVRALGNYINTSMPTANVAPYFTAFQFQGVNQNGMQPANTSPINLQNSETVLINGTPALNPNNSGYYLSYHFDYIIQGGNHLLVANGDYRISLEFSLYDGNNNLMDTYILNDVGFQLESGNYGTHTMILQNSADVINLEFDNIPKYYTGISVNKPLGLKVEYYGANEIMVKTAGPLRSNNSNHEIPPSRFKIEINQTQKYLPNVVTSPPVSLSANEKIVVQNPHSNYNYTEVEYDLRVFVSPSDAQVLFGNKGTFSTRLIFIVLPK